MTPFATWRSRLPAAIGTWFARDLVKSAMPLVDAGRVTLRAVEDLKIEATVADPPQPDRQVAIEWAGGTGPLALRAVCTDGGSGICPHIVATLEAVRLQTALSAASPAEELELSWLPQPVLRPSQLRARSVWIVFSIQGDALGASLVIDSPRLRGATREAAAVLAMMDATPVDDWDDADRELIRDEAVLEAFVGRASSKALARALFAVATHPRKRFDDDPSEGRHPSDLPDFTVDMRGLRLLATRDGRGFGPLLQDADGTRLSPRDATLVEGPPPWLVAKRTAYLVGAAFDARRIIDVSRQRSPQDGTTSDGQALSAASVARVAPFLPPEERAALGIVDAADPRVELALAWTHGALVSSLTFVDRATGASAPFASLGAIAAHQNGFVRFTAEQALALRSRLLDAGFVPRSGEAFALHGAERAATFVRGVLPQWTDIDRKLDPSLLDVAQGESEVDVAVSVRQPGTERNWFELQVDVFVGGQREALTQKELDTLLQSGERFAEVRGKLLDVERLRSRRELLADLAHRRRSGFAALVALRDEVHANFDRVRLPPEVEQLRERLRNFGGIEHVEPPKLHDGALRVYQERGLDFLSYLSSFAFGGILADEMGLGKTLQVLAHLILRKRKEGVAPSLVIAPTSVTHTWEHEIARFAPELSTLRLQSGSERATKYDSIEKADVVITSYALARLDAETLAQHHFRTLVLDEAQSAKNPSSQIARVVRALQADHRIALTGTPVENSLRDLWAIFSFVEPGLLGSEASFRRRFELPIQAGDQRVAAVLRSRLEPFVLRRTKEDVAPELPERVEIEIECDLSALQLRLYRGVAEAARREVFAQIDAGGIESATVHVLAALTRLRQICAHPGLLFEEYRDAPDASGKFDAFLETVDEILSGGHRLLVFSAFASMLRIIRTRLDALNLSYGYLDGATRDRDRSSEVARFMRPDGPPLFLCSLKAGGVGLTLTAADYVILYDPWWNPAVERQAIDRTHRIGQHRSVTAYRLVSRGSVEEKIRALAERKADLSRNVIKADASVAKTLTRADLELLLADPA